MDIVESPDNGTQKSDIIGQRFWTTLNYEPRIQEVVMTAQADDRIFYNDYEYRISAVQYPQALFDIKSLGISPIWESTACYRGYEATFSVLEGSLVLKSLDTNNGNNGSAKPVVINGFLPDVINPNSVNEDFIDFRLWRYRDINLPIPYTGSILISDNFIDDRYVHGGHQSVINHDTVIKLKVVDGSLIEEKDISDYIAYLRKRVDDLPYDKNNYLQYHERRRKLHERVEDCLDLSLYGGGHGYGCYD